MYNGVIFLFIAGLDIGTTGCKCSVYDDSGKFVTEAYREYTSNITKDFHTISAKMIWENIILVMKEITKTVSDIKALCVTSFGEASVLTDENGTPLTDCYLFTDPNGQKECDYIDKTFGSEYIYNTTGLSCGKMYSVCKWKWIKDTKPEIWEKCRYIFLIQDYIVYKLCGVRQIDYTLATRTMAFNVNNLCWDKKILDCIGIDEKMLSKVVPTGSKAKEITTQVQRETGLLNRTLIVSGCHDQVAAAIGTGVLQDGMAVDGTGTVECMTIAYQNTKHIHKEILYNGGYATVPYMNNLYITYAFSYTGGALLKWYRDNLAQYEAKEHINKNKSPFIEFDKEINCDNPSGLLVMPYFAGAGTPYLDNNARGAIIGLSLDTKKSQIYQALMEGVTYEMRLSLDILDNAGIKTDKIFATGGGAKSSKWLQIKADILNKEIISTDAAESGTLGCIMLCGVACGVFRNLQDATSALIRYKEVYKPRKEISLKYDELFKRYKELYPRLYKKGENYEEN